MRTKIIGLHGQAGAGKSTLAAQMRLRGWDILKFATPVYDMADAMLRSAYPGKSWEKDEVVPMLNVTYGRLLQLVGTEAGRDVFGPDVWVDHARARLQDAGDLVLFDDCRFDNEAEMIRAEGGLVVEICRTGHALDDGRDSEHRSAARLPDRLIDLIIYNDGSVEDLADWAHYLADVA